MHPFAIQVRKTRPFKANEFMRTTAQPVTVSDSENNSSGLTFDLRRFKADEYSRFVNSVLNGKNKMPSWKGVLEDAQINQLWAYIRASGSQ